MGFVHNNCRVIDILEFLEGGDYVYDSRICDWTTRCGTADGVDRSDAYIIRFLCIVLGRIRESTGACYVAVCDISGVPGNIRVAAGDYSRWVSRDSHGRYGDVDPHVR